MENALIRKAMRYAAMAHDGQYRKTKTGRGAPYITHCIDVVSNIYESSYPCTPVLIASALLHDVVEDTDLDIGDIGYEFGDEVAERVDELTLPPSCRDDAKEKLRYQTRVMRNTRFDDVRIIKIADKLDNIESLRSHPPNWGKKAQLNYIKSGLQVITAGIEHVEQDSTGPAHVAMLFLSGRAHRVANQIRLELS